MKTPAPTTTSVNLLPTDRFEYSRLGRFLKWALSTGRYVVVLTELVVIIAFLSRFWFDRRLTDLKELRIQKSAIVQSFDSVKREFEQSRLLLTAVREALNLEYGAAERLDSLQGLTPAGIEYDTITISSDSATLSGFAASSSVLSRLLTSLGSSPLIRSVTVESVEQDQDQLPGFSFSLTTFINL